MCPDGFAFWSLDFLTFEKNAMGKTKAPPKGALEKAKKSFRYLQFKFADEKSILAIQ